MLPKRCLLAVSTMLGAHALCVAWLVSAFGHGVPQQLMLGLAATTALGVALAALALRPLDRDLARLGALVAAAADATPRVSAETAASVEASPLFSGLALLQARSGELEAVERDARRAIEEAERLRASFVAAMGHDLRGPLNAVIGFADLLVMAGQDPVAASQRGSVDLIRRSAQDLLVLLEQILDWAKLEAGQLVLSKSAVRPSEVIEEAVRTAIARSADRGLQVELDVAPDLPELQADARRLSHALLSLMDHAARAPSKPRLALRACIAPSEHLPEGTEAGAPCLRIELRDPQLLVRQADKGEFFQAFRPSYAPSGRRVAGLGLGPALARALIRAHGGEVWFESEPETGTTFTAELPLSAHAAA